jgi:glutamate dehydrogenase (NAD(P)+)
VQYALREFFREHKDVTKAGLSGSLDGKRIIVQGLGNVGYHAAKFLSAEDGSLITGIIERDGAIHSERGLDVDAVRNWIMEKNGVSSFPGATYLQNGAALLEADCDILIPAALEGVINIDNAANIKAPLIIEAANGPVTASADSILREKGCVIIPDMYANAGGVTVSYFEWVKNLSHIRFGRMQRREQEGRNKLVISELENLSQAMGDKWDLSADFRNKYLQGAGELELVRSGLDDTMRGALQSMRTLWHERPNVSDLRTAAYLVAIEKISASYKAKGL